MHRWVHGGFALLALALVVVLLVLWPRPDDVPEPTRPPPTAPVPQPSDPTTTPVPPTGPPSPSCPTRMPSGTLTVLSFNIHGGLGAGGSQLERVAEEIGAWDADVVLLQEVDRHRQRSGYVDQPAWLGERLGMTPVFGANVVRPPPGPGRPRQEYGTAVLSRLPVESWSNTMLPNRRGLEQRGLLRVTVRRQGQLLDVYNTHLQHTRGTIRIEQLRAVRRLLRDVDRPVVLGGDLNATPDSPAMRAAYAVLRDPWPVVGQGPGLTVPPNVPQRRIDYVLHDDSFVPLAAQVLRSAVSDHRAVRVVLQPTRPQGCGERVAGSRG